MHLKIVAVASTRRRAGGTYTARQIFDRLGGKTIPADQPPVRLLWQLARDDADVYHIQFEYRTFGSIARSLMLLPLLAAFLRPRGAVVVTLHGLVTSQSLQGRKLSGLVLLAFRSSMKATGTFASAFVVHSEEMRKTAEREYGLHDVFVIPLGSNPVPAGASRDPSSHHVVFFGFIRPEKGLQPLIGGVASLRTKFPNIRLTIAGSIVHADEGGYLQGLRERVQAEGLSENVRFLTKFLSDEEISELMQGATVLALPYTDQFVEVSAIVHDLAGYGVPLVCSNTPRFSELEDGVECLKVSPEPSELAGAIFRIFADANLAARLSERLVRRSRLESWDVVAEKHLDLYQQLVSPHLPIQSAAR